MDRRWNYIVAGLSTIDMIVGMGFGEMADHLIGVHVGGSAAACLKNVYDELIVVFSFGDFVGSFFNGGGEIRW